jgi:hypothetical protein
LFEFLGAVLVVVAELALVGDEVEAAVVVDAVGDEPASGFVELDAVDA